MLAGAPAIGPTEGSQASWARVARVQVLQPGRDGTYGGLCPDGLVYNIEVAGTHTYLIDGGLVVHNCHHAAADSYRMFYERFPDALRVGFTATMMRGDDRSLGKIFQSVAYRMDIADMIRDGYLVRPRGLRVKVSDLDMSQVRKSAGDYSAGGLGSALEASMAPEVIASMVMRDPRRAKTIAPPMAPTTPPRLNAVRP